MNTDYQSKIIGWQAALKNNQLHDSLLKNQISITTTDTVLGLLGNSTQQSFNTLNTIKGNRQPNKPYLCLIAGPEKLSHFINNKTISPIIKKLIKRCWPGPLTIVFKAKKGLPAFLTNETNTIALRCPAHQPLLQILQHFNGLFSTSANISNDPVPQTINDIHDTLLSSAQYIVTDHAQQHTAHLPSTIIDVSQDLLTVIRQGAYSIELLKNIIGSELW